MAKKKKNTKPTNLSGAEKKSASQKKVGDKKSSKKIPTKKESVKKSKSDLTKKGSKKKTPLKKETKKKTGGGGKKGEKENKLKKGAGFSSNNFNYIRALIWREYGLDYVSYFDPKFINIVRAVYNECKAAGQECTDSQILIFYDEISENPNRDYPYIDEDLYTNPTPYYQILDVKFDLFPAYLWVISEMIMPPPSEFIVTSYVNNKEGSADKGYRKYFKEFVDWCNEAMRNQYGSEVNSDDIDIYIKFTKPEYKEEKQKWETEIIICNSDGEPESFGFEPKGRMSGHDVEDEFEKPIEEKEEKTHEEEGIKPVEEKEITPEEAKKSKENNEKLFSLLLKMKKKKEQLESKEKAKVKKKIEAKRKKVDVQANKQKELKRLKEIKKEFEKSIILYKKIGDKKRMNKALKDLDVIMNKIKKLG